MGRRISMATRKELLGAVRERYKRQNREGKSKIIDEFVAVTGYHRKHALRLSNQSEKVLSERVGQRIYDEAVREALILLWETVDRICGKRLKAALPGLIESMERHGHLDLDSELRDRLLMVSAATIDRLLFSVARLYVNFFQPSFKLREKTRDGAKVTRKYFPPATPCERLLKHPDVSPATKEMLRELRVGLDPIVLLKELREAQSELADLAFDEKREPDPDTQHFLASLSELWRQGESRPTHKSPPAQVRDWRTRADPFETVWAEAQIWLEQEPDITGKTLFNRIRTNHPGEFAPGQLRTLQRRIREWRQTMAKRLLGVPESREDLEPAINPALAEQQGPEHHTPPRRERGSYES